MGKIAPAPSVETFQSHASKPSLLTRVSPLRSRPCVFSALHENENVDIEGNKFNEEKFSPNVKGDEDLMESFNTGRWGRSEKKLFLEGLRRYGKGRWKQIGKVVKRSLVQIKSHGQKVLKKLEIGEDIFAALDKDDDSKAVESQLKNNENDTKLYLKSTDVKLVDSNANIENRDNSPSRTPLSRFAWILPARNQTKEQEFTATENSISPVSLPISFPRKRKGRKKEPKAKVAKTDLFRSSRMSYNDDSMSGNSEYSSDLQQDTAVAVQALSALFLSASPTILSSQVAANHDDHGSISAQTSRVEEAKILLSLMGNDSRSHDNDSHSKGLDEAETSQPTASWWSYGLRRKS